VRVNKTDQLRVRLTKQEREALENIIIERGQNETISDIIREALAWMIHPETSKVPCYLSTAMHKRVMEMSKDLNRDKDHVVEDCVQGVLDLLERPDRKPLVVMELHLRREYDPQKDRVRPKATAKPKA
jgi:hypothetical protein